MPKTTGIRMTETAALLKLMAWLSPAFPTGGFAYSAGLERAVEDGLVNNAAGLRDWLSALLAHGGARNDAIFFALAWRDAGAPSSIGELAQLALALAPSAERHEETLAQGNAFLAATKSWFDPHSIVAPAGMPLPVAAGVACRFGGIELAAGLAGFLQAQISNQLQAAIRLSVIGQIGATELLPALAPEIEAAAEAATNAKIEDIGGCPVMADISGMKHETQRTRLFLS